jgi:hypothetical protein
MKTLTDAIIESAITDSITTLETSASLTDLTVELTVMGCTDIDDDGETIWGTDTDGDSFRVKVIRVMTSEEAREFVASSGFLSGASVTVADVEQYFDEDNFTAMFGEVDSRVDWHLVRRMAEKMINEG